ncbi:hypothetical protein [Micromonospora rubida]|uniref:hypothetical protein n=1 Tax=Micromonospora rubida TaxID=2697657 RepID=UPI001376614C|nr:hypothetical protein [Micromonospora rubida]NBE83362.1 hypothetical protein [Micromonospora rubida]
MSDSGSVVADEVGIQKLAELFMAWAVRLDEMKYQAKNAHITPGHLSPSALDLKARFDTRVHTEMVLILENLDKSFHEVGVELKRIAAVYAKAEHLNKDDLLRLRGLVKSISQIYPDFSPLSGITDQPLTP